MFKETEEALDKIFEVLMDHCVLCVAWESLTEDKQLEINEQWASFIDDAIIDSEGYRR